MCTEHYVAGTPGRSAAPTRFGRVWLPWMIGWLGGPVLGIGNGVVRDLVYQDRIGQRPAHVISTATLLALLTAYMAVLEQRCPIPPARAACGIGGAWMALTVLFEFGFGHYVAGDSWADLLEQYDVTNGHIWILVPFWMAIGPAAIRALRARRSID